MTVDPKAVEAKAVAEANSVWSKVVAFVKAHPKTALTVALAVVVFAVIVLR